MASNQEIEILTRLGKQYVNPDKVIYFPRGLMGFEGLHEFTLLEIRPGAPFLLLQSMDEPKVGLLVADPFSFIPHYTLNVTSAEQRLLRAKDIAQLAVLVTASIPPGKPELTALNLIGPILLNHEARIGIQVPQTDNTEMPTQWLIHQQKAQPGAAQADAAEQTKTQADMPENAENKPGSKKQTQAGAQPAVKVRSAKKIPHTAVNTKSSGPEHSNEKA